MRTVQGEPHLDTAEQILLSCTGFFGLHKIVQGDLGSWKNTGKGETGWKRTLASAGRAQERTQGSQTLPLPFFCVPGVSFTLYLPKGKVSVNRTNSAHALPGRSCHSLVVGHGCVGSTDGHSKEQDVLGVGLPSQGVQQGLAVLGHTELHWDQPFQPKPFQGSMGMELPSQDS